MALLFDRFARVTVDTFRIEGLRVTFKIKKTLSKEPNTADIEIYNLSADTRRAMRTKGALVTLEAGYKKENGVIFTGDARTIDHVRAGPDWITRIRCGDGEKAFQFNNAVISARPNAKRTDVAKKVIDALGLKPGNALGQIAGAVGAGTDRFLKGYSFAGNAAKALDDLVRAAGLTWSIQDGEVQVLAADGKRREIAFRLSPDSGLIGSPEHGTPDKKSKKSKLKARTLLRAELKPGSAVVIDSEATKGNYRCDTVNHIGDSFSNDWFSDLEMLPIS